jgi:3-hydroxybutyryl-CoA dehydrogenase
MMKISILGAGSMGSGIAQVASQSGHEVVLADTNDAQLEKLKRA